jgi:hypothetical protein
MEFHQDFGLFHLLGNLLWLALLITAVVWLVGLFAHTSRPHFPPPFGGPPPFQGPPPVPGQEPGTAPHPFPEAPVYQQLSAIEILRQRYARGEIDVTTYDQMRERIEGN